MEKLLGRVVAALCICMFLAATVHGKSLKAVYLKDGGIIECRTFWKKDGKLMVLVNRDVLVDLSRDEVDMKRTFKGLKRGRDQKPEPRHAASPAKKREAVTAPSGAAGAKHGTMTSAAKRVVGTGAKPAGR